MNLILQAIKAMFRKVEKHFDAVIPAPNHATVGQMLVVKSVDENGKPIEWEAVDMPEVPKQANADWNQNDPNGPGYVENRPFYDCGETGEIVEEHHGVVFKKEGDLYVSDYISINYPNIFTEAEVGSKFKVVLGSTEFIASMRDNGIGNASLVSSYYPDTGEPICLYGGFKDMLVCSKKPVNGDTVMIYAYTGEVKQLDEKFIPDTIARRSDIPEAYTYPGNFYANMTTSDGVNWKCSAKFADVVSAFENGRQVYMISFDFYAALSGIRRIDGNIVRLEFQYITSANGITVNILRFENDETVTYSLFNSQS